MSLNSTEKATAEVTIDSIKYAVQPTVAKLIVELLQIVEHPHHMKNTVITDNTIPLDVYYSIKFDNFYNTKTLHGMGISFYEKWQNRRHEFPTKLESEPDWVVSLRKELLLSKMTHNFTFTRDEVFYLLGDPLFGRVAVKQDITS